MSLYRRHIACNKINKHMLNKTVQLAGWVQKRRDHGHLIFIDVRDRSGLVQLVFDAKHNIQAQKKAELLRSEFVIAVTGKVVERTPETVNPDITTGQFEVIVDDLTILNEAYDLPFTPEHAQEVDEELRLTYRYIDLRQPAMAKKLLLRHDIMFEIRTFFSNKGFYEVETPLLTKNTAEGAREFLVPSRLQLNEFYALPQSPQLYKQMLMASGIEKYFQIARCFRDEDLRADRQPEFTQLDLEMSFVDEQDVQDVIEQLLQQLFEKYLNITVTLPLPRMTYHTAFLRYGTDKPDIRFDMPIYNITEVFQDTQLSFLKSVIAEKGKIGCLHIAGKDFTRSQLEYWVKQAQQNGAQGLIWIRFKDNEIEAPIARFLPENFFEQVKHVIPQLNSGDTLFLIADTYKKAWSHLGRLRLQLGEELKLIDSATNKLLWITNFPLVEYNEQDKRWYSVNHPFTAPEEAWRDKNIEDITSRSYDIVLNGIELGGGSIRIHNAGLQKEVFTLLGLSTEEIEENFDFLLRAQQLGYPPHGGIALGLDRLLMMFTRSASIREVIAFPKTQRGQDLMMGAPTPVEPEKLAEYNLEIKKSKQ